MKKIAIALLILLLLIPPVPAQFENAKKVEIKAVAVTSGEQPHGVVINITVIVTPGNGRVFVSTTPYTEIDMQGSAQLAALTACDLLGMDFTRHDFFYIINANAPIVGGPSAGAVMTVATIAALKGLKLRNDVYMTGMIYPDGFIGPVGGLKYKLEAAAEHGAKIFLIPYGQRYTYVEIKKVRRVGILSIITTEYKRIDLVKYGEKLGVKVYQVQTVNDALKFYTGYEIKMPQGNFSIGEYSPLLKKLAIEMRQATDKLLKQVKYNVAEDLIAQAQKYYNEGMYYTATSKYFQACIKLRYELYKEKIQTAQQFDEEVNEIRQEINQLKDILSKEKIGINSFQIIAAAQERVGLAEKLLEDAINAQSADSALYNLAFAKERVESAKVWMTLLPYLKNDHELSKAEMKKRAEFYINQAGSIIVYASTLNGVQAILNRAVESLDIAKRLYSDGFYAGAAVTAVNALTDASLSIEVAYGGVQAKLPGIREAAKAAIAEAERSVFPILPAAYYEFAETLNNTYAKLMYYSLAERLAKLLTVLAKAGGQRELVHVAPSQIQYSTTQQTSKIQQIIETPGYTIAVAIVAIGVAFVLQRRKR